MDVYRSIASRFITGTYSYEGWDNLIPGFTIPKKHIFCPFATSKINLKAIFSKLSLNLFTTYQSCSSSFASFSKNIKKGCTYERPASGFCEEGENGLILSKLLISCAKSLNANTFTEQLTVNKKLNSRHLSFLASLNKNTKTSIASYGEIAQKDKKLLVKEMNRILIPIRKGISDSVGRQGSVNCPVKTLHRNSANLFDNRSSHALLKEGHGASLIVILHSLKAFPLHCHSTIGKLMKFIWILSFLIPSCLTKGNLPFRSSYRT